MAVTRVEDFAAYEFAVRFKLEVYRLTEESRRASKNRSFRNLRGSEGVWAMREAACAGRSWEWAACSAAG